MREAHSAKQQEGRNLSWWNAYFADAGGWEKNGGRTQTRTFAETFCKLIRWDEDRPITILDLGCALGEALVVFRRVYPLARLHGMDFSPVSIERCHRELGDIAEYSVGTPDTIQRYYDAIYASNIIEHFVDWKSAVRHLATQCSRLGIVVPYRELVNGKEIEPNGDSSRHQQTFYRGSFDFLLKEGLAYEVRVCVESCPGVWGWTVRDRFVQAAKNMVRPFFGRAVLFNPHMMFLDIVTSRKCSITPEPQGNEAECVA